MRSSLTALVTAMGVAFGSFAALPRTYAAPPSAAAPAAPASCSGRVRASEHHLNLDGMLTALKIREGASEISDVEIAVSGTKDALYVASYHVFPAIVEDNQPLQRRECPDIPLQVIALQHVASGTYYVISLPGYAGATPSVQRVDQRRGINVVIPADTDYTSFLVLHAQIGEDGRLVVSPINNPHVRGALVQHYRKPAPAEAQAPPALYVSPPTRPAPQSQAPPPAPSPQPPPQLLHARPSPAPSPPLSSPGAALPQVHGGVVMESDSHTEQTAPASPTVNPFSTPWENRCKTTPNRPLYKNGCFWAGMATATVATLVGAGIAIRYGTQDNGSPSPVLPYDISGNNREGWDRYR